MDVYEKLLSEKTLDELLEEARVRREGGEGLDGEKSLDLKSASFLGDEFGKQINEKIQAKYGTYEAISKVKYNVNNKLVEGPNTFYVVAVNEILQEQSPKFRTATQADLEKILKSNTLPLQGHYEGSSLVLRTKQEPNKYLAEDLFAQFKSKGVILKENSAYVIPLFTLKLRKDEQSRYKFAFDITDSTLENYFEAPILMSKNGSYINPYEIDENIGLPTKVYKKPVSGNRQLRTINSGLSGLLMVGNLDLYSSAEHRADSDSSGRVVLVRAEGTTQNIRIWPKKIEEDQYKMDALFDSFR